MPSPSLFLPLLLLSGPRDATRNDGAPKTATNRHKRPISSALGGGYKNAAEQCVRTRAAAATTRSWVVGTHVGREFHSRKEGRNSTVGTQDKRPYDVRYDRRVELLSSSNDVVSALQ